MILWLLFITALTIHLAAGTAMSESPQPEGALWGRGAVLMSAASPATVAVSPDGLKGLSVRDSHLRVTISGSPVGSDAKPILINNLAEILAERAPAIRLISARRATARERRRHEG